ncbi:MAG: ATP/GTP-binding protein, partial [Candidatus Methanomethylophilaceae archaeon]
YEYERERTEKRSNKRECLCRTEMNSSTDNVHMACVRRWLQHSVFIEDNGMRDEILPIPKDATQHLSSLLMEMDAGIIDVIEEPFINTDVPKNLIRRIPNRGIIEADGEYMAIVAGNRSKRGWLIHIIRRNGVNEYRNIGMVHEKGYVSSIDDESSGTMRMIQIMILMLMLKRSELSDGLVVMDDVECSIHSLVIEALIEMFVRSSPKKGQMIATTHKAYLLKNPTIDDSCISFINIDNRKNEGSRLYTLESMDRRFKDRHRAYMDGRYAAIPIIYSISAE